MDPIAIREAVAGDANLIKDAWLRELQKTPPYRHMPPDLYWRKQAKLLDNLFSRSTTMVACLAEDPDTILGYITYDHDCVYWVYVKSLYRQHGIGKALLDVTQLKNPIVANYTKYNRYLFQNAKVDIYRNWDNQKRE